MAKSFGILPGIELKVGDLNLSGKRVKFEMEKKSHVQASYAISVDDGEKEHKIKLPKQLSKDSEAATNKRKEEMFTTAKGAARRIKKEIIEIINA